MYYPEFKKASKKHLQSCECLLNNLNLNCSYNKSYILTTIFYLSGYILETIMKFSIYSSINYKRNKKITELTTHGLSYKDNIKIHDLKKLKRTVYEKGITRLPNFDNNQVLFSAWNSEIRYIEKINYSEQEIINFFNFAKNTYKIIQEYK